MRNKWKITGILFSLFVGLGLFIFFAIKDANNTRKLHYEYKLVTSETAIDGEITDLYVNKGASFLTLDTLRLYIPVSENYNYNDIYLHKILSVGDIIHKKLNSDTIIIFKQNRKFYFEVGKTLK